MSDFRIIRAMVVLAREQNQALKAFSVALRMSVLGCSRKEIEAVDAMAAEAQVLIDRTESLR